MKEVRVSVETGRVTVNTIGSSSAGRDQAGLVRGDDRLGPVSEVELGQDAGDVRLDRGLAELEADGEFGVGEAAGEQPEDVQLAGGQRGQVPVEALVRAAADGEALDQTAGDGGGEESVAGADELDGGDEPSFSRKPLAPARRAAYT